MAETFNNSSTKLSSTSDTTVYQAPFASGDSVVVLSCLVANVDGTDNAEITLWISNSSNVEQSILAKTISVPADSSVELIPNKIILTENQRLRAKAGVANDLHVTISVLEIT